MKKTHPVRLKSGRLVLVIVIALLLAVIYYPSFVWLKFNYTRPDSYYSHGLLIPLVSAFIVWHKRKELGTITPSVSGAGLLVLLAGLLMHVASRWWLINFTSAWSLVFVVAGLVLFLGGREIARHLAFPIAYLFFMMPLPSIMIIYITFRMKIWAASCSVKLLNLMGLPAELFGSFIILSNATLEVGNVCSGLRSLISLLALGALVAYFLPTPRIRKFVLFLASAPIALGANIFRIMADCWVARIYGMGTIFKRFHDFSGYLIFIIALVAMALVGRILLWRLPKKK